MQRSTLVTWASAVLGSLALMACQPAPPAQSPAFTALAAARVPTPPEARPGTCWAQDVTPAVIETVTAQVLQSPAVRDDTGKIIQPARYVTQTRQDIVQPRRAFQFQTLCRGDITPEFVASLQRALKARGLYKQAITGAFNRATEDGLRTYQKAQGLETGLLTLQTAREFGLVPADWDAPGI